MTFRVCGVAAACLLASAPGVSAQQPGGRLLQLPALQRAAIESDPRMREVALLQSQSDLRQRNISAERLPAVAVEALAQYQSDVPTAPFTLPNGQPIFAPPKATFDGHLRVDQRIFDRSLTAQSALERAQLDESQARVRTTVYAQRQMVNDAFFAAALLQQRAATLDAAVADLEARRRETETRMREGAALPSDLAAV
ncbi:MAG TPA: TolC family protein, partial [Vicinamibacterales bacterium]